MFSIFVAVGLTMATTGNISWEFAIARWDFVLAAIDVAVLVAWWIYKNKFGFGEYLLGVIIFIAIVICLPIVLRRVDDREASALKKPRSSVGILVPKNLLTSSSPKSATRSTEIGDSGQKFSSLDFF